MHYKLKALNLVIDVGNSRTKLAVFDQHQLTSSVAISELTKEEVLEFIKTIPEKVKNVMLSSVGKEFPELDSFFTGCFDHFLTLSHKLSLPIEMEYETPETLGMDRLSAVVGAKSIFPETDLLVIDTGTCITYDFISASGKYTGGGISPGINMRFQALHNFTGRLPLIDWKNDKEIDLIGSNTQNAMKSGVWNGVLAELDGIIARYECNHPALKVVVTGGDSKIFDFVSKKSIFADPNLVLFGLNKLLRYNIEK